MKRSLQILVVLLLFYKTGTTQIIYTAAGISSNGYSGDGSAAASAQLDYPYGLKVDKNGNVYIADSDNDVIRKINTSGIITTVAGLPGGGYSGDGGLATLAKLNSPVSIEIDSTGDIYISDIINNCIRKINNSGIISTIAGNGLGGFTGDGGQATLANLNCPWGLTKDNKGNIYFADLCNRRIRKVNAAGIISTIAGNGNYGYSGDGGQATLAEISDARGIIHDKKGNVYFADKTNQVIRKIDTTGIISTFAGTGNVGFSGDGGLASLADLNFPQGLTIDSIGNIYIIDSGNRIRMVDTLNIISTICGNGGSGFSGDGGPPILATINNAYALSFDKNGNLYFADSFNQRIRVICKNACFTSLPDFLFEEEMLEVYPNPNNGSFVLQAKRDVIVEIINGLGQSMKTVTLNGSNNYKIDISELANGVYLLRDKQSSYTLKNRIVVLQ